MQHSHGRRCQISHFFFYLSNHDCEYIIQVIKVEKQDSRCLEEINPPVSGPEVENIGPFTVV